MNKLLTRSIDDLGELTFSALTDFCDGYRWMFDKDFQCTKESAATVEAGALDQAIQGIIATSTISYTCDDGGSGKLIIVLDKDALFSLGGTTVMFPVTRIKEDRTRGSEEEAQNLSDALGEVSNLLKGSFSKQFNAGLSDGDGAADPLDMQLCLPGAVVSKDSKVDEEASEYHFFTYQFACPDFDPFFIRIIYPVA